MPGTCACLSRFSKFVGGLPVDFPWASKTDSTRYPLGSIPVVQRSMGKVAAKRTIDIVGALSGLLLLSPLMLLSALLVSLTDRGPIFFIQQRVGKGGRMFGMIKFRTMVIDAEAKLAELAASNEKSGPIFKMKSDPRITPVGKILRRYSIDELPQLINVLIGDMSLVGPRPPVLREVMKYRPWQMGRLSVSPGLTCIWQTSGRSDVSFEQWMKMDIQYIRNWSVGLDLALIFKTVKVVLTADGAY